LLFTENGWQVPGKSASISKLFVEGPTAAHRAQPIDRKYSECLRQTVKVPAAANSASGKGISTVTHAAP
jgi:hypothetical protein